MSLLEENVEEITQDIDVRGDFLCKTPKAQATKASKTKQTAVYQTLAVLHSKRKDQQSEDIQ